MLPSEMSCIGGERFLFVYLGRCCGLPSGNAIFSDRAPVWAVSDNNVVPANARLVVVRSVNILQKPRRPAREVVRVDEIATPGSHYGVVYEPNRQSGSERSYLVEIEAMNNCPSCSLGEGARDRVTLMRHLKAGANTFQPN